MKALSAAEQLEAWARRAAQDGAAAVSRRLQHARREVEDLTRAPRFRFERRRHEHAEPFDAPHCGWCQNIRGARRDVECFSRALELAEQLDEQIRRWSLELSSQVKLAAKVREAYPRVTRERLRELWHEARRPVPLDGKTEVRFGEQGARVAPRDEP